MSSDLKIVDPKKQEDTGSKISLEEEIFSEAISIHPEREDTYLGVD